MQVNIDDCWQLTNRTLPWSDPKARQIANPYHFPSGMKALADHLHNLDPPMKFGVYTARCKYTCQLFAASFSHEAVDAQLGAALADAETAWRWSFALSVGGLLAQKAARNCRGVVKFVVVASLSTFYVTHAATLVGHSLHSTGRRGRDASDGWR